MLPARIRVNSRSQMSSLKSRANPKDVAKSSEAVHRWRCQGPMLEQVDPAHSDAYGKITDGWCPPAGDNRT